MRASQDSGQKNTPQQQAGRQTGSTAQRSMRPALQPGESASLEVIRNSPQVAQHKRLQAGINQSQQARQQKKNETVQFDLTREGQDYLNDLRNSKMWGGYPEAHALASRFNFKVSIFSRVAGENGNRLQLMEEVGAGNASNYNLLWNGAHYVVIIGGVDGGNVPNTDFDPRGDGNCMFVALFYILRGGGAYWQNELYGHREQEVRASWMRNEAANELTENHEELTNILGEEHAANARQKNEDEGSGSLITHEDVLAKKLLVQFYKQFLPSKYYYKVDKKNGYLINRTNDKEKIKVAAILQQQLDWDAAYGTAPQSKEKQELSKKVEPWLEKNTAYGLEPLVKGTLEGNTEEFAKMEQTGKYAILPPEDGREDAETNKPSYDGLRQCVLQGISHLMAQDRSVMDSDGRNLYFALYDAKPNMPWYAFKNYTDDAVNPVLFHYLGFERITDYDGQLVGTVQSAEEGWYLLVTPGHVEAIEVLNGEVEIDEPSTSNERHAQSGKRKKTLMTTKDKDKVQGLYRHTGGRENFDLMLAAGKKHK